MGAGFARGEKLRRSLAAFAVLAFAALAPSSARAEIAEPASAATAAAPVRLFGSSENANDDITPFPKWTGVLARYAAERHLEQEPCRNGHCALQEWRAFVASLEGQDRMRQLEAVNAYVNRVPYQSDESRYGVVDYWATPREFFGKSGDCEDYAIAKYLSLRNLGWAAHELRVVVLKDETRNELHAILIAYHGGTAYVLDNLIPGVREHAVIRNYRPIFSINEAGWYYHRDWSPATAVMAPKNDAPARAPDGEARVMPAKQADAPQPAIGAVQPAARSDAVRESAAGLFSKHRRRQRGGE